MQLANPLQHWLELDTSNGTSFLGCNEHTHTHTERIAQHKPGDCSLWQVIRHIHLIFPIKSHHTHIFTHFLSALQWNIFNVRDHAWPPHLHVNTYCSLTIWSRKFRGWGFRILTHHECLIDSGILTVSHFPAAWVSRDKDKWAWDGVVDCSTDGWRRSRWTARLFACTFLLPFQEKPCTLEVSETRLTWIQGVQILVFHPWSGLRHSFNWKCMSLSF